MPAPTQPEPAEGPPADDAAAKSRPEGQSAETPVEGADDSPPQQPGSPRG